MDWMDDAACQGMGSDLFFPEQGEHSLAIVKKLCATCPVNEPCLEYALAEGIQHGVWGGLTENERRALRKDRQRGRRRRRKTCGYCRQDFFTASSGRVYCSAQCGRDAAHARKNGERAVGRLALLTWEAEHPGMNPAVMWDAS